MPTRHLADGWIKRPNHAFGGQTPAAAHARRRRHRSRGGAKLSGRSPGAVELNRAVRRVDWPQAWRVIASRYPPITLFERLTPDPAVWEALIALEQLTNPRVSR